MPPFFLRLFPYPFLLSETQSSHECLSRDSGALTLAGPSFIQLSFHWEQQWQLSVHSGGFRGRLQTRELESCLCPLCPTGFAPQDLPQGFEVPCLVK